MNRRETSPWRAALLIAGALGVAVLVPARASAATSVDTLLFLSLDISGSIDDTEYATQKNGYVAAFQSAAVQNAILNSPNGVAVGLSEWATQDTTQEIPWTLLTDQGSINSFVSTLQGLTRNAAEGGATCISCGLNFGVASILNSGYTSGNVVLDISGDGTDNVTSDVAVRNARDLAVANGIKVNGLPILGSESNLDTYYLANVVSTANGGQNYPASGFEDIARAAEGKISFEISGGSAVPGPLPLLGAGAAFGFTRRLRSRIRIASPSRG